jgi:hypothetical protein
VSPTALDNAAAITAEAAGVSVFALSRRMGTSLAMIDATYGHLAADAERVELDLLDAYDATCGRGLAIGMSED